MVHTQVEKQAAILDHFREALGTTTVRQETLNWEDINLPRLQLSQLEEEFTEEEIKEVVMDLK